MTEGGRIRPWPGRSARLIAVGALGAVLTIVAALVVVPPADAGSAIDVGQARAQLAEFVAENELLPSGSETPTEGPPCPLATVDQLGQAAATVGSAFPVDFDPWYAYAIVDSELRADAGGRFNVVRCLTDAPGDMVFFALDISPVGGESIDFDRVARRFGVGQAVWIEPERIGGVVVGSCVPTAAATRCTALWHREGLVLGLTQTGAFEGSNPAAAAAMLVALVPGVLDTLVNGLPSTTTTTTTSTTTSTSSTTSTTTSTSTTLPLTTTSSTTTTLPPTTTSTTATTLPPTTTTTPTTLPPTTTSTTTTLPPTTTTTTTSPATTTTTTTLPPTTTTTTTLPPTTTTTTTSPPTTTTTTTTLPPTTTTTTTSPPTTTTTTTTTTTLPPTTTTTTTTSTTTTSTTIPAESTWDRVLADPELSLFAEAVQAAGLVELVDGLAVVPDPDPDPEAEFLTVLAPTNDAIEAIPNWAEILADPVALDLFVLTHLVDGVNTAADIFGLTELTTLSGEIVTIDQVAQTINGATLVTVDLTAVNGILHSVDRALFVPPLTAPIAPPTEPAPPQETVPPEPVTPETVPPDPGPPATPPASTP